MNTTLHQAISLFEIALVIYRLRTPAVVAKDKGEKGDVLNAVLDVVIVVILGVVMGGVLGDVLDVVLGGVLGGVMILMLVIVLNNLRSVWRKRPTKAIKTPNNDRPPQFAEYLLYFLPKTMRQPLLGDLEEEYREVYARFGKRKATIWYYVQVLLSYWPLLCRAVRKLVKWGVLGWLGGAVRRLIS